MTTKRIYFVALLGVLSFYGCSDDSSGTSSTSSGTAISCTQDSECASGKCLSDGNCAILVGEGEACDNENICKNKLKCVSGICKVDNDEQPVTKKCEDDSECGEGQTCSDGECKTEKKRV